MTSVTILDEKDYTDSIVVELAESDYVDWSELLHRLIAADQLSQLVEMYLAASFTLNIQEAFSLVEDDYAILCKYLAKNHHRISGVYKQAINSTDLSNGECRLTEAPEGVKWKLGVNYPATIQDVVDQLDENWEIEGVHHTCLDS
jgi:hypothetical protein